MLLEFDRGTILCRRESKDEDPGALPGVKWDARVGRHRAPARFHRSIRAWLQARNVPLEDRVSDELALERLPMPELRPYQAAALDAWTLSNRRGIVALPTGSGKTRIAMAAIAASGRSALCLVPTRVLLEQWHAALSSGLASEIGLHGDGMREVRPVTVATFESAYRHMHALGNRFGLLVVDEVHHFGRGQRDEALDMSIAPLRLGLTATPAEAAVAASLGDLVGPTVFELGIAELAGSYLADFELVEMRLDLTPRERDRYESAWHAFHASFDRFQQLAPGSHWNDFQRWAARTPQGRESLAAWHRARKLLALTEAKQRLTGTLLAEHREARALIFAADKEAVYGVAREHLVMPITADIGREERAERIEAFRLGRIRALVSARVLNEGFDVPAADVGIVLGGALGVREHVQRVGRLLRPAPGKRAVVYELVARDTFEVHQARRRRRGLGPPRAASA